MEEIPTYPDTIIDIKRQFRNKKIKNHKLQYDTDEERLKSDVKFVNKELKNAANIQKKQIKKKSTKK
ncbi:hypothetical protein pb186bvf_009512 [Paramecium bursaria]